jgi:N-formylglutamate deformylase
VGTANGQSADPAIAQAVTGVCSEQTRYSHVLNGRFKGGYITRRYGQPAQGIHAVQLELCQDLYMQECAPYAYLPERARVLKPTLERMLRAGVEALHGLRA